VEDDVNATATGVGEELVFGLMFETPLRRLRLPFKESAQPQKLASIVLEAGVVKSVI